MSTPIVECGYAFDNSAAQAVPQFDAIERYLDPITAARLGPGVLEPGMRCWELGAGGGSIARMLSNAVGPTGRVVATDLEPCHVTADGNVTVHRHDVRSGPVEGGPFDLIHARLVLLHIPERRQILRDLVGALAPGGWLVIEEFDCTRVPPVLTAPDEANAATYCRVLAGILTALERRGADMAWARGVHDAMTRAGLVDIDTVTHAESWSGGSSGASLYEVNSHQLQPALEAMGIGTAEIDTFRGLTRDPAFATLSYEFVSTRGRKPGGRAMAPHS